MMPAETVFPEGHMHRPAAASGEPATPDARAQALQAVLLATLSHCDRLLAHFREVEGAFAGLAARLDGAPRPEEIAALVMRFESARREMEWLAEAAGSQAVANRLAALQARLDMVHADLTSLREEAERTAALAEQVALARQELEGLAIPMESIARTRAKSESLMALVINVSGQPATA